MIIWCAATSFALAGLVLAGLVTGVMTAPPAYPRDYPITALMALGVVWCWWLAGGLLWDRI